jgi:hypothetical protein
VIVNLDKFIRETGESLEFVNKNKQIPFVVSRIKTLTDTESRDIAESKLVSYIKTGDKREIVRPRTICFTLHGIRTDGTWQADLKRLIERDYENIETLSLKFGFWNAIAFLTPWTVDRPITHINNELKMAFNSEGVSEAVKVLIAHSYGTYVMYSILNSCTEFKFDRIILCGSVLRGNSDWGKITGSVVINDCGTKDIYPSIAKAFSLRYGTAGLTGITHFRVEDRFHRLGHSDFFTEEFMTKYWLKFIADGEVVDSGINADTPYYLNILGTIQGLGWILLVIFCVTIWYNS